MRRLLLVAYHFPPEPAAGALRPGYIAKYLREFGWEVTVLTRAFSARDERANEWPRVVSAPVLGESLERTYRERLQNGAASASGPPGVPRRLLRWIRRTLSFPDRTVGWLPAALARGWGLRGNEPFDAVLSTAMPATVHIVGAAVAARFRVPWVADYRDPWSGNPGFAGEYGAVRAALDRTVERSLLRRAAAITTISEAIAGHLSGIHRRPVAVIPNGAEPRDWDALDTIRPRGYELCYTGTMYAGLRTPALLFESLAALRAQGDPAANTRVVFLGPSSEHVREEARRFGIEDLVEQRGVVTRGEALVAQREASHLLIFLNMDPASAFELGSKVIEYTQARRPILAFGPEGSVMREHLRRFRLGWFASNLEEGKDALRAAHGRWLAGERELTLERGSVFEARDVARAFAAQLDAVL